MLPGMFEEYLAEDADRRGVEVSPEVISHAGIHTAREAHKIYRERNYEAIIISGTAQRTDHWTELVGQGMAVTLSGKLGGDLIDEHPPVVERIGRRHRRKSLTNCGINSRISSVPVIWMPSTPQSFARMGRW